MALLLNVNLAVILQIAAVTLVILFTAPTLGISGSTRNDQHSVTFICNATCLSDFVVWLANDTLLSDISDIAYHKTSNRNSVCYESDNVYVESLHLIMTESDIYPYLFSCAAIFLCSREEVNQNCAPRMCYSVRQNKVDFHSMYHINNNNNYT